MALNYHLNNRQTLLLSLSTKKVQSIMMINEIQKKESRHKTNHFPIQNGKEEEVSSIIFPFNHMEFGYKQHHKQMGHQHTYQQEHIVCTPRQ